MVRELRTIFFKIIRNPDNGTSSLSDWSARFFKSNEDKKEVFNKYLCSVFKEKTDNWWYSMRMINYQTTKEKKKGKNYMEATEVRKVRNTCVGNFRWFVSKICSRADCRISIIITAFC